MLTRPRILLAGIAFLALLAAGAWFVVTQVLSTPMLSGSPDIRRAEQVADHTTITGYRRIHRFDDSKFTLTDVYVGKARTDPQAAVRGWNFTLGPPLPTGTVRFQRYIGYANVNKPDYYDCSAFLYELTPVDNVPDFYGLSADDVKHIKEDTEQALGLDVVCGG
jgi:hypothetical protein